MSELYHDGALCPECEENTGIPALPEGSDQHTTGPQAQHLRCAVCGHEWTTTNYHEVARAWFAHGAYEQHLREQEAKR